MHLSKKKLDLIYINEKIITSKDILLMYSNEVFRMKQVLHQLDFNF